MTLTSTLGYPRIGPHRELKAALETFWKDGAETPLLETARKLRAASWRLQKKKGIDHIPSNDFTLYDHVLDTICMTGAVPERFAVKDEIDLPAYFAMARGAQDGTRDVAAMEMTKWFDTNYHYIVPEFTKDMEFRFATSKVVDEFREAKALGVKTRPVLVGPFTFLKLGKAVGASFDPLELMGKLLPVYEEVLKRLADEGADWVQMDEPSLVFELGNEDLAVCRSAYTTLARSAPGLKLLVATYFGELPEASLETVFALPVAGVHLDFVRGRSQFDKALSSLPNDKMLSLGLIEGRNIWRTDLDDALSLAERAILTLGPKRVAISSSCSLLHVPYSLAEEDKLDAELKSWLAFAEEKLDEIAILGRGTKVGRDAVTADLAKNASVLETRRSSPRINNVAVRARARDIDPRADRRNRPFAERHAIQAKRFGLPPLPTTTIGSFPQTAEVRKARAATRRGEWTQAQYDDFMRAEIEKTIRLQERIGLDVLVHGEPERTDMVEYFGEKLEGFAFTRLGWVQSYGSRCVKPPIIFGDVSRPEPMTVDWARYAQSLTKKPVKGMLTGPVTILQWSFVRDDQPRSETCKQIALAISDEVYDLESAGIGMIQIDEPALREGLPLRRSKWNEYLDWACKCFRLAVSIVRDETQIHTHMCYSEFNDIIEAIADLDADVISIETSRSRMELLDAFVDFAYPNDIGPGVYDIHSPRVPARNEMLSLLRLAADRLPSERIWVNPDCGLKTRGWPETEAALIEMVAAAQDLRNSAPV